MSSHEPLVLPSGTAVIVVETVFDCEGCDGNLLADLPKVYAGHLREPHPLEEGIARALLLDGPFARSIAGNAFEDRAVAWSEEGETLMIFIAAEEDGTQRFYWVLEDTTGLVDEIESSAPLSWLDAEDIRRRLYNRVMGTFTFYLTNMFALPLGYSE